MLFKQKIKLDIVLANQKPKQENDQSPEIQDQPKSHRKIYLNNNRKQRRSYYPWNYNLEMTLDSLG